MRRAIPVILFVVLICSWTLVLDDYGPRAVDETPLDGYEPPYETIEDSTRAAMELDRHNREHYEAVMGQ